MKYKVFIFGTRAESRIVRSNLRENTELVGYLDNCRERQEMRLIDGTPVLEPGDVRDKLFDYIILSLTGHIQQVKEQLRLLGIPDQSIIPFFFPSEAEREEGKRVIDNAAWERDGVSFEIKYEINRLSRRMKLWRESFVYEAADIIRKMDICFPVIEDTESVIDKIVREGCSLCRFGDGEFEIMRGNERPLFQKYRKDLAERLSEVFHSDSKDVLIGIPDQFGSLEKYMEEAAEDIREYMNVETRQYLDSILNYKRSYADTYLSRPYFIYKDKSNALKRFMKLRQIWDKRDIVIVEGEGTRMGVGNNLLDNAAHIQRLVGPSENAFDSYDEMLAAAKTVDRNKLFLISLGPAATVLAYDLAAAGYQAVDIGHIDLEYEWFLRNVKERTVIADKYVNEVLGGRVIGACADISYESQIIVRI